MRASMDLLVLTVIALLIVLTEVNSRTVRRNDTLRLKNKCYKNQGTHHKSEKTNQTPKQKIKTNSFETAMLELRQLMNESENVCDFYNPEKPDFISRGYRVSEAKFLEYIWDLKIQERRTEREKACGEQNPGQASINKGRKATRREFPHMGALGWRTKKGIPKFLCASAIISESFLITAAHCRSAGDDIMRELNINHKEPEIVRLGVENTKNDDRPPTDIKIKRIHIHPRYNDDQSNDMALMKLQRKVEFSEFIRPAGLWFKDSPDSDTIYTVAGWGKNEGTIKAKMSVDLMTAQIQLVEGNTCAKSLKIKSVMLNRKKQLCFKGVFGNTCEGDSGGVVQEKMNINSTQPIYRAIAITSFGAAICGIKSFPSVYTNIASSIGWIEKTVWG